MADPSILARPYAKAAFEMARDSGRLKEWSAQLHAIAAAVGTPDLQRLIGHPAASRSELERVLLDALAKALDAQGQSLLRLLVENNRLRVIGAIVEHFEALRADAESRADVEIVTATDVGDASKQALTQAVRKRLSRDVAVQWRIDDSLVGGALIRCGDLVIDGSLRGELEKLHTAVAR